MWKSFDKRLADFLLEECVLEDSNVLKITHGSIEVVDKKGLQALYDA